MHLANWIRATSVTGGASNLVLAAVSGYPDPASQFSTGQRFQYQIYDDATGAPVEQGIGYLNDSGHLVREVPMAGQPGGAYAQATSAGGITPLTLTGTVRIGCAPMATGLVAGPKRMFDSGTQNDNMYLQTNIIGYSTSSLALQAANRLLAYDAEINFASPVDAIACKIGATGGTADIVIYETLPNGMPGAVLLGWQNITLTANMVNVMTFAAASHGVWAGSGARLIAPGHYKIAINGSASIVFMGSITVIDGAIGWAGSNMNTAYLTCMRAAGTNNQGTILDPFPTAAPTITSFSGSSGSYLCPAIFFRRAP